MRIHLQQVRDYLRSNVLISKPNLEIAAKGPSLALREPLGRELKTRLYKSVNSLSCHTTVGEGPKRYLPIGTIPAPPKDLVRRGI